MSCMSGSAFARGGGLDVPVILRYSRYLGWSSDTINLSKLSLRSVSKALVNAPGP